jgi:hypothetical protein
MALAGRVTVGVGMSLMDELFCATAIESMADAASAGKTLDEIMMQILMMRNAADGQSRMVV